MEARKEDSIHINLLNLQSNGRDHRILLRYFLEKMYAKHFSAHENYHYPALDSASPHYLTLVRNGINEHTLLSFSHDIIFHACSHYQNAKHYYIIKNEIIGHGNYAYTAPVVGKLTLTNVDLVFREWPALAWPYIVKYLSYEREALNLETNLLSRFHFFHSKPPTFFQITTTTQAAIIFKYFPGNNLERLLSTCTLSILQRLIISYLLLKRLQELHDHNVIHGDIKLENIMVILTEDPWKIQVYFIDFGLSRDVASPETGVGTPLWAAPELFSYDPITQESDVFSAGLVVGRIWNSSKNMSATLGAAAKLANQYTFNHLFLNIDLKKEQQTIIEGALLPLVKPKPEERGGLYDSAHCFEALLKKQLLARYPDEPSNTIQRAFELGVDLSNLLDKFAKDNRCISLGKLPKLLEIILEEINHEDFIDTPEACFSFTALLNINVWDGVQSKEEMKKRIITLFATVNEYSDKLSLKQEEIKNSQEEAHKIANKRIQDVLDDCRYLMTVNSIQYLKDKYKNTLDKVEKLLEPVKAIKVNHVM